MWKKEYKQVEAELGQDQVKLEVIVEVVLAVGFEVGIKVGVEIEGKDEVQQLVRRVGGWWIQDLAFSVKLQFK